MLKKSSHGRQSIVPLSPDMAPENDSTQKYFFISTTRANGEFVAVIADAEAMGPHGAKIARALQADGISGKFNFAVNSPLLMQNPGLLTMTAKELEAQIPPLQEKGLDQSAKAFTRGINILRQKNGMPLLPISPTLRGRHVAPQKRM